MMMTALGNIMVVHIISSRVKFIVGMSDPR